MENSPLSQTRHINDIEMNCEIDGEGEPLVLLHGFLGIGSDWRLIFKEVPAGFRLVMPDLRGHGRSTNPLGEFTFRQSALDVFALLNELGIERFKAIGVSGGGQTLLHMAISQPDRIEAMVLVSSAPYFPEQARVLMRQMTVDSHSEDEWQMMRQRHKHGDDQIRALLGQAHAFKDSYDDMSFTPPHLATITARTLIVSGDSDPLYPVSIPVEMFSSIPGSYLWILPNGGHGAIFGAMAGQFAETALAFLRGEWIVV